MIWRALALLAAIVLAGAACAEPAFMRIAAGKDELVLGADDIGGIRTSLDQSDQPAVIVMLEDDARSAFAAFTRQHVGMVVDVFVCDVLIVSPKLMSEISGGQVMLTGDTADAGATLENRLRAKSCR